jgi:hypothetical protein
MNSIFFHALTIGKPRIAGCDAGVQGIYGPVSNIVECAADVLRLLGHNMPPQNDETGE